MSARPPKWWSVLLAVWIVLATCASCAAPPPPPPPPPLPAVLWAPGGRVDVLRTRDILVGEDSAWGAYDPEHRVIFVDSTAPLPHQLRIYYHEATHVALNDAGLDDLLEPHLLEAICNAMATARVAERRAGTSP